jgi:hypothetical protein
MGKRKESPAQSRRPINGETLRSAVSWAIEEKIFADVKFHGNVTWKAFDLILLVMVWVWSDRTTLRGAFEDALHWSNRVLGRVAVTTYQGMVKALVSWTAALLPLVQDQFRSLMEKHGGKHWRVGCWLALAVDGSRIGVPRTEKNEKAFCAPNYGHGQTAKYRKKKGKGKKKGKRKAKKKQQPVGPQMWLTLLWHLGLHMPWSWQSGPSYASEREHFRALLDEQKFPENTLFCGDAGFVGYDLWKAMSDAGHSFLIRVGANVRLLRNLGYVQERPGLVYCWPDAAARKRQPPLVLRLIQLRVGRCSMWLVTNALEEKRLSDADAVELYRLRWGVELQFRTVKQTFGRRKLRSRTPDAAQVELDWSLMGLWLIQLFAVKEQVEIGVVPERCSVGLAVAVIREMLRRWSEKPEISFSEHLRGATKDGYKRKGSKKGRYQPKYKDKPSAGKPKIKKANRQHKLKLRYYLENAA